MQEYTAGVNLLKSTLLGAIKYMLLGTVKKIHLCLSCLLRNFARKSDEGSADVIK